MVKRFLFLAFFFSTSLTWASFSESVTGGRATALDGALTAAPGDVFSLYYNPAGLTDLDVPEAGLFYGRLFKGLTDGSDLSRSFFGWASPTKWGSLGLSYGGYSLGNLYNEETISFGYANTLGDHFRWGTVINHLKKSVGHDLYTDSAVDPLEGTSFNAEDPAFAAGRSASAWDFNLGATWIPTPRWRFGLTGVNLLESDVGLTSADPVPRVLKAAGSFSSKIGLSLLEVTRRRVGNEFQTRVHGGIEKALGRFAIRAGGGLGPNNYTRVSGGFSAKIQILQVDYGFMIPLDGVKDTSGTHQVSVIMRFGQRSHDE
jgi:hypothetical protein